VNFQGLEKEAINRGDVLSVPQGLKPSYMVDVQFRYLASNPRPIKNRTRVRFHTGTSEILGNLILLDRDELAPGAETAAQLRLDQPVALVKGDHFVVRSYSPVRTTGGGRVLNPIPPKHKRFKPEIVAGLTAIPTFGPEQLIGFHIEAAGSAGVAFADLRLMTSLTDRQLDSALQAMMSHRTVVQVDKEARTFIHRKCLEALIAETAEHLKAYHKSFPLKSGMLKEELKSKFPPEADIKVFNLVLNQMIKDGIELRAFEVDGWFDCGKPESLLETNRALLEMSAPPALVPGSIVVDPVFIAADAVIEDSIVGPYVSVAEKSVVRKSIVRNSIIGENASVENALLDSSLVGDNAAVRGIFKRLNVGDSSEIDFT
jgi:hypothetical protein